MVARRGRLAVVTASDCELCEAARITPWFHEDDVCWIAECEMCDTPMVVWKAHAIDPEPDAEAHMLAELARVADAVFGDHWNDPNRRSIPDHWHVHARPSGAFYGHGRKKEIHD
jgi:hypothetical protein